MPQDADEEGDLQPHQHPDRQYKCIEHDAEVTDQREEEEQPRSRPPSERRDQDLYPHENAHLVTADVA